MKLDLDQIKAVTAGAVRVQEEQGGIHFYRFTKEQEDMYEVRKTEFYSKTFATSGIKLRFRTDSRKLRLAGAAYKATTRFYYAIDIYKDGEKLGDIKNFDPAALTGLYTTSVWELGDFDAAFDLGEGEKEICIYLPWSAVTVLTAVELNDGASIVPVKRPKKLLCFGDSITHGYDARYPANKYATRLAAFLDADEHNQAIGGEVFYPELAATKQPFTPDYISVAYGTNDWSARTREQLIEKCTAFYANLATNYPDIPIFAITPVWRKDEDMDKPAGLFSDVEPIIREATKAYRNITVIPGYDLIPHEENLYGDLRLHPNDEGFAYYAENLTAALK